MCKIKNNISKKDKVEYSTDNKREAYSFISDLWYLPRQFLLWNFVVLGTIK